MTNKNTQTKKSGSLGIPYTPGPWYRIDTKDSLTEGGCQIWQQVKTGKHGPYQHKIAEVINYADNQSEANARLIANAPELYEALETLADWVETSLRADERPMVLAHCFEILKEVRGK